jgi:FKBP-type peptidyl-prolyl cis-trans isomerase FkpA
MGKTIDLQLLNMKKSIIAFFVLPAALLLASCMPSTQKTASGLEYIIFPGAGNGPVASTGSTVKLHYQQLMHDTVTMSTFGKMPYYKALIPGTIFEYDAFEVLGHGVHEGDSIVVIMRMDSLLSKGKVSKLPAGIQPTDKLLSCIKVLKVFPFDIMNSRIMDSLVYTDRVAEKKKTDSIQTILGPVRVKEFLQKHNVTASVTPAGTWLQVIEPGSGPQADSGKQVSLLYKVTTLQGKLMDTNMDSSFHHTDTLKFEVGSQYMMKPVDATIRLLKKGAHAKMYVPAMVAYGNGAERGAETTYDDVIFEVMIADVKNKQP